MRCRSNGAEKPPAIADPEGSPHSLRMRVLHLCLESLLCLAMPLCCTGVGHPVLSSEVAGLHDSVTSSSYYGYSECLEQAIVVHLGLCMFNFGDIYMDKQL